MKKIFVEDIMSFKPCIDWPEEKIQVYDKNNDGLTPLQICELSIKDEDKLWILLRPEIIKEKDLHELACVFAERALINERNAGREPNAVLWAAIDGKRKWLKGEISDQELKKLKNAINAVLYTVAAASYAAAASVVAAASDAAYYNASYTAADAAAAAYTAAAYDAADAAAAKNMERKKQIEIVKNVLKKYEEEK